MLVPSNVNKDIVYNTELPRSSNVIKLIQAKMILLVHIQIIWFLQQLIEE